MTYKQIEAAREARLWIGQIIVPTAIAAGAILSTEDGRKWVDKKTEKVKAKFKQVQKKMKRS